MSEFTLENLALIKAMCQTACPRYPEVPMYPMWADVYEKAERMIQNIEKSQKAMPEPPTHPTWMTSEGQRVVCRTMPYQRPCGVLSCTREECV